MTANLILEGFPAFDERFEAIGEDIAQRGRAEYAAQIRSWRAQAGMTLRQFALAAGTSASRLSDYENAKVAPTTDVLGRLNHVATHLRDS